MPTLVFTMDYETRPTIRCSDGFNHSNANGYFLVSTDKETYRVNSDGSFRKLPIVVDASVCFTGMDTGFISRASESIYNDGLTYYPFGDGGTYIQGTGSKGASGQLGVAKSSASAGSTATAIVLFS